MLAIGVDIGGTKSAVCLGELLEDRAVVLYKCETRKTAEYSPQELLEVLAEDINRCKNYINSEDDILGIGISCGGPLDSKTGTILSPPNLLGWDYIPIASYLEQKTGLDTWLCNDANAGALAEWKLGAGKGCSNMIYMTFGTGLGAGLILDNRLYTGTCDMAGEVGHIRLANYGPAGYGKMGSFEGFCSGEGIAQLAKTMVLEELQKGNKPELCGDYSELETITAEKIGKAAKAGDPLAKKILNIVGVQLGRGLALLIDLLNPEKIVIGSIFARCYDEIWPWAKEVIEEETLPQSRRACQVVPSALGELVGDVAALMVAWYYAMGRKI